MFLFFAILGFNRQSIKRLGSSHNVKLFTMELNLRRYIQISCCLRVVSLDLILVQCLLKITDHFESIVRPLILLMSRVRFVCYKV